MAKKFMVIRYHIGEDLQYLNTNENQIFSEYDQAFEAFSKTVQDETWMDVSRPKGEKPLRSGLLWDEFIELWVVNVPDELTTK